MNLGHESINKFAKALLLNSNDELKLVYVGHAALCRADTPEQVLRDVQVGHDTDHGDDGREVVGDGDAEDLDNVLFAERLVKRPR